jgi:quinol monooxygenase YgiN
LGMEILSIVKITPIPGKRKEILDILHSVKGPTQAIHGCLACSICEEDGDDRIIFYMEHWRSREEFIRHIRSSLYTRMLEAMELSRKKPEVCFFEVSAMKGMELIEGIRRAESSDQTEV